MYVSFCFSFLILLVPLSSHDPAKWFSAFNKVEEIVKSSNYPDPDNCLLTLYEYALEVSFVV